MSLDPAALIRKKQELSAVRTTSINGGRKTSTPTIGELCHFFVKQQEASVAVLEMEDTDDDDDDEDGGNAAVSAPQDQVAPVPEESRRADTAQSERSWPRKAKSGTDTVQQNAKEEAEAIRRRSRRGASQILFSQDEIIVLKLIFSSFDKDGNDEISRDEFEYWAVDSGLSPTDALLCLNTLDLDSDGVVGMVDWVHFAAILKDRYAQQTFRDNVLGELRARAFSS